MSGTTESDMDAAAAAPVLSQPLHEGSMVQLLLDDDGKLEYGVVHWIGELEGMPEIQAGVEMVSNVLPDSVLSTRVYEKRNLMALVSVA